jgi:mRNA (2'-O-methyladenosine-N6-)-methyltransferase
MDICEKCFDNRLQILNSKGKDKRKVECESHDFQCIELPLLANGLAAHNDYKCVGCYMRPIIGACFICADCNHFSLC